MKFICFFSSPPKCNLSKIKRKLHRKLVRDLDKNVLYCVMVLFSLSLFFFFFFFTVQCSRTSFEELNSYIYIFFSSVFFSFSCLIFFLIPYFFILFPPFLYLYIYNFFFPSSILRTYTFFYLYFFNEVPIHTQFVNKNIIYYWSTFFFYLIGAYE